MLFTRRFMITAPTAFAAFPVLANDVQLLTAVEAHEKMKSGAITLIDVREPVEWAESGVAEGAARINMRNPELGPMLMAAVDGDRDAPIALICRTGARSQAVADAMAQAGFTNVYSVGDGMFGSSRGPGWLRSGLPLGGAQ
jgi:rhodanese-related sulfurtransferase